MRNNKTFSCIFYLFVFVLLTNSIDLYAQTRKDTLQKYDNQMLRNRKTASVDDFSHNLSNSINFISKNISFFIIIFSLIGILIGKFYFGISLLQPLEKISFDQQEYRRKNKQEQLKVTIAQRHIDLGSRLIEINNLQAAKEEFKLALSFDQHNNEAEFGLFKSQIFENFEMFGHSIETIRRKIDLIIEHNPSDSHAFYFLGMVYRKADVSLSIMNFKKAITLHQNFPDAYFQLGGLMLANNPNNFIEALNYYETALRLSEHNARYLNNVANLLYTNSRLDEAVPFYEILIKLNNNYLLPYLTFSNILFINKDFKRSLFYIETFIEMVNNSNDIFNFQLNTPSWIKSHPTGIQIFIEKSNEKLFFGFLSCFSKLFLMSNIKLAQSAFEQCLKYYVKSEKYDNIIQATINEIEYCTKNNPELIESKKNLFKLMDVAFDCEIYINPQD